MRLAKRVGRNAIVLAIGVVFFLLPGSLCWADPGLLPTPTAASASLDFSEYPNGPALREGVKSWDAHGWRKGAGCLVLLRSGSFLEVVVDLHTAANAVLSLTHRSGYAPGCTNHGYAPISISVNGSSVTHAYVPSSAGLTADSWDIGHLLRHGENRIRITAGSLCSVYELRRLEVSAASAQSSLIEAVQMTHDITSNNRPIDVVSAFSPTDQLAVCWAKVSSEAMGRRIEFRFYDPSGNLYFKTDRRADRYNWGYIRVRDWRAATLRGQWRVDVSVAGSYQASLPFTIGPAWFASTPRVIAVNFPSMIRANGKNNRGTVIFYDRDGDIARARFDVIDATSFTPFAFEPSVGGQTDGAFPFRVYSNTRQAVTLKVTFYDQNGNASAPYPFTFQAI